MKIVDFPQIAKSIDLFFWFWFWFRSKNLFLVEKKNKKFLINSINSSLPHRFWFWFIFSDSKCGVRSSFDSRINNGLKFERWMAWFSIKCAILIIRDLVFGFSFEIKFTNTKYHWIYAHYIEQFRFSFSYSFNGFFFSNYNKNKL